MKQDPEEQIPEYDEIFRFVCLYGILFIHGEGRGAILRTNLTCTDVNSCPEMMTSHQVMKRKMNGEARGGGWTKRV